MAISAATLVETVGAGNTYVTLEQFTEYCERRLNTGAFQEAGPDDKIRVLLMAASRLDREQWIGSRARATQTLAWPRNQVPRRDDSSWSAYYRVDEIPQAVKDAQCELALSLLDGYDDGEEDAIDSFSADGVSVKFRRDRPAGGLPAAVSQLISGFVCGHGSSEGGAGVPAGIGRKAGLHRNCELRYESEFRLLQGSLGIY